MKTRALTIAIIALLALGCAPAAAQPADDAWVVERVVAGRFDELRRLKEESDRGAPAAMYWWGEFLEGCVFDPCGEPGARALWMKAATAGNSRAKMALMVRTRTTAELDGLLDKLGPPATLGERLVLAYSLVAKSSPTDQAGWTRGEVLLRELAASEPRMSVLLALAALDGDVRHVEVLQAVVDAGYVGAGESLRRAYRVRDRAGYPELLVKARAGEVTTAVALCESVDVTEGYEALPAELLPLCEDALRLGFQGMVPVLLRHHRVRGNIKAAAFYAGLCEKLAAGCASELAEYHFARAERSPAWTLWDAVAGLSAGFPAAESKLPASVLQQVFSIRVRVDEEQRACLARRFDAATKKFEESAACPWRKPIAIPAEFAAR